MPQQKPQFAISVSPHSDYGRSPSLDRPSFTTDDIAMAKFTRHNRVLEWLRIALSGITLVASIIITACAGVALRTYTETNVQPQWLLPLWPMHVDLRPTHAILACGIVLTVFSLVYLGIAFAPLPSKQTKLNIASALFHTLGFILSLFTTIFAATITNKLASSSTSGSLSSWTCKWHGSEQIAPANFPKICDNGNAAYDLVVLLTVLEFLGVVMAAGGWLVEGKLKRARRGVGTSKVELV